jgi:protein-S-isoprenylcysteine O-methyltransferase Ste14
MTETRSKTGPIAKELTSMGDALFRWRSYTPLVLIPLFVFSVADDRRPTSFAWELVAFGVALSGLALRIFVVGTAPPGASTRGTRAPTAVSLSTLGAYSMVRHPLYLANTLIALGCSLLSGTWYLPLIIVLLSFIYHERIAAREEEFLEQTFGERFRAWASRVPAVIPSLGSYRSSEGPFQFRRVFTQEVHGLCAIGTAFLVLQSLQKSMRVGQVQVDPFWLGIFITTFVPFLIVLIAKRGGQLARRSA